MMQRDWRKDNHNLVYSFQQYDELNLTPFRAFAAYGRHATGFRPRLFILRHIRGYGQPKIQAINQ